MNEPSRFNECLKFVLDREGGYTVDHAGPTNFGITQRVYDEWRERRSMPRRPVLSIEPFETSAIYREAYWNPCRASVLPVGVDLCMFDCSVNSGVRQASKWLQRAVGVTDDGVIGPRTLEAVGWVRPLDICESIISQRSTFYRVLVERRADLGKFLNGWQARNQALREAITPKEI